MGASRVTGRCWNRLVSHIVRLCLMAELKFGPTSVFELLLLSQEAEQAAALWFVNLLYPDAGEVERHRLERRRQLVVLVQRDRPSLVERVQCRAVVAGH